MASQRHGWSCLHLTQVYDWTGWKELDPLGPEKVTLTEKRYSHTSWKSPDGLLLIGGAGSPTTTEFVKTNIEEVEEEEDYEEEDEKKKKKPRNVYGFSMEHKIQDACGIPVEDTFILTGICVLTTPFCSSCDAQEDTTPAPLSPCTISPATSGSFLSSTPGGGTMAVDIT